MRGAIRFLTLFLFALPFAGSMRRLLFTLLFPLLLVAQQPGQTVVQQITDPKAVYTMTLAAQATPCTLIFVTRGPVPVFTDSAGNTWTNSPNSSLSYTTTCSGAADTLTVTFPSPTYFQGVLKAYAGQWTFGQVTQSGTSDTPGLTSSSASLIAATGNLLVGFGYEDNTNFGTVSSPSGWFIEGFANEFLEDAIATASGPAVASATWAAADSEHMALAVFTQPAGPYTFVLPNCGKAGSTCTFTFPIASAPSLPACATSDTGCYLSIQVCDTSVTPANCLTLSSSGAISIVVNSTTNPAKVPLVTATSP
jgi:hypothetical protein